MALESPRPFLVPPTTAPTTVARPGAAPVGVPRIPTGVPDFDYLTGGIPTGSVVLLFGAAGAGHQEFALTSAVHLMLRYDEPRLHRFYLGSARGPFVYPDRVVYISTSRSRDQILNEVEGSFEGTYPDVLARHLTFHDLSPAYFADTVVPAAWSSVPKLLLGSADGRKPKEHGPVEALAEAIDEDPGRNLVIVDSLTDLLVRRGVEPSDLLTLVKGLRRRAKEGGGMVYLLLAEGVAPPATEQAIIDSVDGVLHFSWVTNPSRSHRDRSMLIEKFMPVLARLPAEHHGRFVIRVNSTNGLVTTQYERI